MSAETAPDADGVVTATLWILGHGNPEFDRGGRHRPRPRRAGGRHHAIAAACRARPVSSPVTDRPWGEAALPGRRSASRPRSVPRQRRPRRRPYLGPRTPGGGGPPTRRRTQAPRDRNAGRRRRARTASCPSPRSTRRVLAAILRRKNVDSMNLYAEVSQAAGAAQDRRRRPRSRAAPGPSAPGSATRASTRRSTHDGSGLSYRDRIRPGPSPIGSCRRRRNRGGHLRLALPGPGQGTLGDRLHGERVRAKTGTLTGSRRCPAGCGSRTATPGASSGSCSRSHGRRRPSASRTRSCAPWARTRARFAGTMTGLTGSRSA